jgi:hypothetical protein
MTVQAENSRFGDSLFFFWQELGGGGTAWQKELCKRSGEDGGSSLH